MEFEYDPRKSKMNKNKHGIDFIEAQLLWEDDDRISVRRSRPEEVELYES